MAARAERTGAILAGGRKLPQDERGAIGRAFAYFDRRAFEAIGIRDEPRSEVGAGGIRGQLHSLDESTDTRARSFASSTGASCCATTRWA